MLTLSAGWEYTDCIQNKDPIKDIHHQKRGILCVILNCIWWWGISSRKYGVRLHCQYSQADTDPEW